MSARGLLTVGLVLLGLTTVLGLASGAALGLLAFTALVAGSLFLFGRRDLPLKVLGIAGVSLAAFVVVKAGAAGVVLLGVTLVALAGLLATRRALARVQPVLMPAVVAHGVASAVLRVRPASTPLA